MGGSENQGPILGVLIIRIILLKSILGCLFWETTIWICVRRSLVQSCMKIMASMEGCRAGFRYRLRAGLGFIRFRL